jgi:predicted glycosyltransferase
VRIWIDLANSPHVPFFRALVPEFRKRGHEVVVSARDFAQTVELSEKAGLQATVIGRHGGRGLGGKGTSLFERAANLARWARKSKFDLAVSHNSYSQILAARLLGLRTVTLMDYEHQPANHLAFRFASRVIVPESFPSAGLRRFGAAGSKTVRYSGIKEDVYLANFQPDPDFRLILGDLGISPEHVLVVVRPPARDALYHRFENDLFDLLMAQLASKPNLRVILLPRTDAQRSLYRESGFENFVVPLQSLDGSNLISASDLVISAGGTMNREAAALGIPAATIYAGEWAAIDEMLVRAGRLLRIATIDDLNRLEFRKKPVAAARAQHEVRSQVVDLILEQPCT